MPNTARMHDMRRRRFVRALAAAALAPALARPAGAQTAGLEPLRLATNSSDDVTPVLWAQHTGMFAKAGLAVDLQRFNAGSAVTAALAGGALDVGKADLLPIIGARSHGIPLQLVAPAGLWSSDAPISGMVVLAGSPLTDAKDLDGKVLPAPGLHDLLETATRAWVDAHGGDAKTLRFIEMPTSAALGALVDGRIVAATLNSPYFGNAVASGKVRVFAHVNDAIAKRFMISGWFASESFIAGHRDALARFARVVEQASLYTNAHPAETVALSAAFTGIEPDVLANLMRAPTGSVVDPKEIQPLIDVAVKYDVIASPIDLQQFIAPVALRAR
jgi:NitT/TauT family transport system substrate-binding protein